MTHSPVSNSGPSSNRSKRDDVASTALLATRGSQPAFVGAGSPARALRSQDEPAREAQDTTLVDQAGRPLGPRALKTRQRILFTTIALLDEKPMRDLRVIDIARRIGSSPATFYQYFKDVEDVVLHLAAQAAERTPEIVELIHGDWSGRQGHERGRRLVNLVIDHWEKYAPILRVRNNAADEGDANFRRVRLQTMMPMVHAFADEIMRAHEAARAGSDCGRADSEADSEKEGEWRGGRVHPTAGATALASVLERLAMYHVAIEELGGTREDLVETAATLIQAILTSRR